MDSPNPDGHTSNRLTFDGPTHVDSKIRRLAEMESRHLSMGDSPSYSSDTPVFLGTISKTRSGSGRGKEERAIPDTGCTANVMHLCIVRDHNLEIKPVDKDEPGMKGFGDHRVPIIGQVSFWYKARRFARKKLVKALVSDTETREILLSWQTLSK